MQRRPPAEGGEGTWRGAGLLGKLSGWGGAGLEGDFGRDRTPSEHFVLQDRLHLPQEKSQPWYPSLSSLPVSPPELETSPGCDCRAPGGVLREAGVGAPCPRGLG